LMHEEGQRRESGKEAGDNDGPPPPKSARVARSLAHSSRSILLRSFSRADSRLGLPEPACGQVVLRRFQAGRAEVAAELPGEQGGVDQIPLICLTDILGHHGPRLMECRLHPVVVFLQHPGDMFLRDPSRLELDARARIKAACFHVPLVLLPLLGVHPLHMPGVVHTPHLHDPIVGQHGLRELLQRGRCASGMPLVPRTPRRWIGSPRAWAIREFLLTLLQASCNIHGACRGRICGRPVCPVQSGRSGVQRRGEDERVLMYCLSTECRQSGVPADSGGRG
jgi:hypothetical protein